MRIEQLTEWPEDAQARQRLVRRRNSQVTAMLHRAAARRLALLAGLALLAVAGAGMTELMIWLGWIGR